jgi:hypothetical protein
MWQTPASLREAHFQTASLFGATLPNAGKSVWVTAKLAVSTILDVVTPLLRALPFESSVPRNPRFAPQDVRALRIGQKSHFWRECIVCKHANYRQSTKLHGVVAIQEAGGAC